MTIYSLDSELIFPNPRYARQDGLLAVGGDLNADRLLLAYECGIFPWFSEEDPIMWWSPDPRCVLFLDEHKVSKSMRNILNRKQFEVTFDQSFSKVVTSCQHAERKEKGTWITNEIVEAYSALHDLGLAHSVEVWRGNQLVGGLYGVSLGRMFFGESMFSLESNTSKIALNDLVHVLKTKGFEMIDCQVYNSHLASLGARNIDRDKFLELMNKNLKFETLKGSWASFHKLID